MFKKRMWMGIMLLIIFLVFSINGFTAFYKYTQESGTNFYVGTDDKADALEDTNELRQIIDDLGALLGHSLRNNLYPKNGDTGGYLGRLNYGLDASKPAVPVVNDMYLATDTAKIYRCFVAGNWIQVYPGGGTYLELVDTPATYDNGKYAKSTADGVIWDTPTGAGDMLKATYDTDTDGIVDKSETVDDGVGNSSTAAEVKDAVNKKHSQNTDTDLDATFEATFVKKTDNVNVLADITSPGADIEDAVDKKHAQNTDTALGTQTQDLNMGTHKITGVVDPTNPQEAATKAYADTKVATEVDPTVDSDAEIKAILVDEVTKTGDFTATRLPEIDNSTGIIKQSDIEHKANGGYDFNINSAGFTTQTATGDGNTTCDWRIGLKYRFVFGAQDETFTFTNPEFSCHLQVILIQDGTGSRLATWPAGIYWATGTIPILSTAGNARDTVNFFFDDYDDVYYGMGIDFAVVP